MSSSSEVNDGLPSADNNNDAKVYDPANGAVRLSLPSNLFVNSPGVAFDIGGSRCKVAFIRNSAVNDQSRDADDSSVVVEFNVFSQSDLPSAINYVKTNARDASDYVTTSGTERKREVIASGTKLDAEFRDTIERVLQAKVVRRDEFSRAGKGLGCLLKTFPADNASLFHDVSPSVYKAIEEVTDALMKLMASVQQQQPTAQVETDPSTTVETPNESGDKDGNVEDKPAKSCLQSESANEADSTISKVEYPHMLVISGSGTSCVLVSSDDIINFVCGSQQGGLPLLGLSKLLINVSDYNELMDLAERGDEASVTIMSRDLRNNLNSEQKDFYDFLPPHTPMYPFARVLRNHADEKYRPEDVANALVKYVINGVVREVFWAACSHNCNTLYAAGGLFEHRFARDVFNEWFMGQALMSGKPQMKCQILKMTSFLAALGSLLGDTS